MPKVIDVEAADTIAAIEPDSRESKLWYALKKTGVSCALVHRLISESHAINRKTIMLWLHGKNKASPKYHATVDLVILSLEVAYDAGLLVAQTNKAGKIRWLNSTSGYETMHRALAQASRQLNSNS